MHNHSDPSTNHDNLAVVDNDQVALVKAPRYPYGILAGPLNALEERNQASAAGILQYWQILRRHTLLWLSVVVGTTVVGYLTALPQTPSWKAVTSIEVLKENSDFMNLKQATSTNTEMDNDSSEVLSQISLLQSRVVLKRTVAKLKAAYPHGTSRRKSLLTRLVRSSRKALSLKVPSLEQEFEQELNEIGDTLNAKPDPQTRVVQIAISSFDPQLAAAFANTLTSEFIDQNMEARLGGTEKTSAWLGHQLDDMRKELENSEDALQQYARSSGLIFAGDDKSIISEKKLEQVQLRLSVAQADRIVKQARYEDAQKSPAEALPDVLNDQGLRDARAKLAELRRQKSDLVTLFTPDYQKVRSINSQIGTLQAEFESDRTAILGRVKDEYVEAARTEELLKAAYVEQAETVSSDGQKSVQHSILKNAVDSNRLIYQTMLQQLKQSTIASAMRASTVRVVDPADVPSKPYRPIPALNSGVGTLAGLFFGAVFIILREQADRTLQQPGEGPLYLGLPELGVIPSEQSAPKIRRRLLTNPLIANRVEMATWNRRVSPIAESFRSTLISILFANHSKAGTQLWIVSSGNPSEGKSTIASNLAIALAELRMKILLIDGDLRRPRLHTIFNMDNHTGLSRLLEERPPSNGDWSMNGAIRESEVPNLFILTSGPVSSNAANMLYGSRLPELVKYFRREFEVILVDTPPMLQIPDARIIGRVADGVILVIRSGVTQRSEAIAASQRFAADGTKMLGTILNGWDPRTSSNGSYYHYRGHYRQHYSDVPTTG